MHKKKAKKILEGVRKTYETIAEDFSRTRAHYGKEFDLYLQYAKRGGTIVDIGCGNGRFGGFLRENREKIRSYHYLGIDQSEKMIEIAQKKQPEDAFMKGTMLNLPLDQESTDMAISIRTFHHIPSHNLRLQALMELQRVLKKEGILVLSVWNLWQKKYIWPITKAIARSLFTLGSYEYNDLFIPWGEKTKRYYHAFTAAELIKIVKKAGFTIVETPVVEGVQDHIIIARK